VENGALEDLRLIQPGIGGKGAPGERECLFESLLVEGHQSRGVVGRGEVGGAMLPQQRSHPRVLAADRRAPKLLELPVAIGACLAVLALENLAQGQTQGIGGLRRLVAQLPGAFE